MRSSSGRRFVVLALTAIGFAALAASQAANATSTLSATGSVDVHTQFLGDPARTFTFTFTNTGTSPIKHLQITRPPTWTVLGCPGRPPGWSAAATSTRCTFDAGAAAPLAVGATSSAFQVLAQDGVGRRDRSGAWTVNLGGSGGSSGGVLNGGGGGGGRRVT